MQVLKKTPLSLADTNDHTALMIRSFLNRLHQFTPQVALDFYFVSDIIIIIYLFIIYIFI